MGEAQIVESVRAAGEDLLDLRSEIMAARKVETHRPTAAAAIVAIALAQCPQALLLLVASELPRVHKLDDD